MIRRIDLWIGMYCVNRKILIKELSNSSWTERETMNTINGHNAVDCVAKYKRIQIQTALKKRSIRC